MQIPDLRISAPHLATGGLDTAATRITSGLMVLLLALFSVVGALAVGLTPQAGQTQLAVIAAPWRGLNDMVSLVAAADGTIVDVGGASNVIIASSDSPGFVTALYRAGAWLVLDPILLRGCLGFRGGNR